MLYLYILCILNYAREFSVNISLEMMNLVERRNLFHMYLMIFDCGLLRALVRMNSTLAWFPRGESALTWLSVSRVICQIWQLSELGRNDDRNHLPSPTSPGDSSNWLRWCCVPLAVQRWIQRSGRFRAKIRSPIEGPMGGGLRWPWRPVTHPWRYPCSPSAFALQPDDGFPKLPVDFPPCALMYTCGNRYQGGPRFVIAQTLDKPSVLRVIGQIVATWLVAGESLVCTTSRKMKKR